MQKFISENFDEAGAKSALQAIQSFSKITDTSSD